MGRLYVAAIAEGKGDRWMEAGVDGGAPVSANAQGPLGEEKGGGAVLNRWAGVQYTGERTLGRINSVELIDY